MGSPRRELRRGEVAGEGMGGSEEKLSETNPPKEARFVQISLLRFNVLPHSRETNFNYSFVFVFPSLLSLSRGLLSRALFLNAHPPPLFGGLKLPLHLYSSTDQI